MEEDVCENELIIGLFFGLYNNMERLCASGGGVFLAKHTVE
jgi:hypothetical protein